MGGILLPHCGANAPEHRPCGLIGNSKLVGQLDGRDPALVLRDEVDGQEPLAQADVAVVRDRPVCNGVCRWVAAATLIQPVGQAAAVFVPSFWVNVVNQRCAATLLPFQNGLETHSEVLSVFYTLRFFSLFSVMPLS